MIKWFIKLRARWAAAAAQSRRTATLNRLYELRAIAVRCDDQGTVDEIDRDIDRISREGVAP